MLISTRNTGGAYLVGHVLVSKTTVAFCPGTFCPDTGVCVKKVKFTILH